MSFDPSLDIREEILNRLVQLGETLPGIACVARNHGPAETGILGVPRPAFLVYDAGAKLMQDTRTHKSVYMPPTIWCMTPQIVLLLENRDTVENVMLDGVVIPVGPELSKWKKLINDAVVNDPVITDLVTPNGTHFLNAFETDLQVGRTVGAYGAWLMMLYEFYFPVFPSR